MMNKIVAILMKRDKLSLDEAQETFQAAYEAAMDGEDPEEILHSDLGLEPDYIFDLLQGL